MRGEERRGGKGSVVSEGWRGKDGEGEDGGQAQSRRRYFCSRLSHCTHPTLALKNASPRIVFTASFSTLVESDKGGSPELGSSKSR
ncbi:hypothetical protein O3P69_012560 [Scylla paramamosain]|uniref:Uncharacterized protein n=1 Tax=Scylla paramamosain TaxID=85552 RepID=A0AAW0SJ12_SCYPA